MVLLLGKCLLRRAVRLWTHVFRRDLLPVPLQRPQRLAISATVFPARLLARSMWLLWPLRWCFGGKRRAKRQTDKEKPDTGNVAISVDAGSLAENDLTQQLWSNDSLGLQFESRLADQGSFGEQLPAPAAQLEAREEPDTNVVALPTPPALEIPTPVVGPRRPRHSTLRGSSPSGTKTTGCKRTIPDSRTPRGEQHRVLTVQIPLDASEHNGTVSTPNDRHIPSPLPLLTPALPTPPKAPAFSSGPSNGESSTTPGASQESMYAGTSGTGGAATWSNWGDWDLRSPSWDVPRTPIPHLQTDSAPMTLGPPPEDQVLRRRNTPFDHRADREQRKSHLQSRKSRSPDLQKATPNLKALRAKEHGLQKENVVAPYTTPEACLASVGRSLQAAVSGSSKEGFPEFVLTPAISAGGCVHTPNIVGVNNPPSQFREDKRLRVHETPFERRVESFIQQENNYKRRLSLAKVPAE